MAGGSLAMPFLLFGALCVEEDDTAKADIISTIFFVSGMVTILQTVIGVRLPIVQGSSFGIFNIVLAILSLPEYQCPTNFIDEGWGNITQAEKTEEWQKRMRVIQGSLAVASIVQVILGYFGEQSLKLGQISLPVNFPSSSGLIGLLLRFITPLTIAPMLACIGLSLLGSASGLAAQNWYISIRYYLIIHSAVTHII